MSDPTAPVEGAGAAPEPAPASTPEPWAPVISRVDELASNIDTRFQALEGRIPEPEAEPEPDPWAALFGEPEQQPEYEQPQQPALDPAAIQTAFQQALQQANAPLMAQVQQMQAERAREQLLAQIPQLKDPAVAQQTIDGMVQSLQQSNASPDFIQWALSNPQQIALHFKAAEAEKLAAGQAPASEQVPAVESAGGAVPGGSGEQPSYVQSAHEGSWGGLPPGLR
jgi:hypothetical protein